MLCSVSVFKLINHPYLFFRDKELSFLHLLLSLGVIKGIQCHPRFWSGLFACSAPERILLRDERQRQDLLLAIIDLLSMRLLMNNLWSSFSSNNSLFRTHASSYIYGSFTAHLKKQSHTPLYLRSRNVSWSQAQENHSMTNAEYPFHLTCSVSE